MPIDLSISYILKDNIGWGSAIAYTTVFFDDLNTIFVDDLYTKHEDQ